MNVLRRFWDEHPLLSMWILLSIGMVAIMIWAARSVGFTASQWAWLIVVTIGLAGLCTWIISWGEDDLDGDVEEEAEMQVEKEHEAEPEAEQEEVPEEETEQEPEEEKEDEVPESEAANVPDEEAADADQ